MCVIFIVLPNCLLNFGLGFTIVLTIFWWSVFVYGWTSAMCKMCKDKGDGILDFTF